MKRSKYKPMKKSLIALGIAMLLAGGAYAQTKRLNRTNTRTHDRSDAVEQTDSKDKSRPDRMNHQTDVDRNNTNNNTNTTTNGTGSRVGNANNTNTGTGSSGTNTNGGTGTNGANIHTNNPR